MIGSLRGVVLELGRDEILVEVAGIGYRVSLPSSDASHLELGAPTFLHVHTHVREDAIILYGFLERSSRDAFEALIATHGVGPSLALAILSVHSVVSLRRAVASGDAAALYVVPGVGPKTAARLLLELENRLVPGPEDMLEVVRGAPNPHSEVRIALSGLGYGTEEIRSVMGALPVEGEIEDLLRRALRELSQR
jgi:holliday junction DNA helicase RuvA